MAKKGSKTEKKGKPAKTLANGGQTIELSLPAELYDKIAKQEEAKLTSILTSVLAKKCESSSRKRASSASKSPVGQNKLQEPPLLE